MAYHTELDDRYAMSTRDEREMFQQKLYYYLNELRTFLHESPLNIQTKISEEVINELAHIMAQGQIFPILSDLIDSQRVEEQTLHKQLVNLRSEQSAIRANLVRKHNEEIADNGSRTHHLPILKKQHEVELQKLHKRETEAFRNLTMSIIESLDCRVTEQQAVLERLGVPHFTTTTNSRNIRIQMRILDWIVRLVRRPYSGSAANYK